MNLQNTTDILIPAWVDDVLTPVEKLAVHQRGLRHKAVSIFLIADGDILLQKRAAGKYHTPGLWANTVCTHPAWGEDTADTAQRRLAEELGITNVDLTFRRTLEYRADVGGDLIEHEVVDLFTGHVDHDLQLSINPDEVSETCWISPSDLRAKIADTPDLFTPWLKIYVAQYAQDIFTS